MHQSPTSPAPMGRPVWVMVEREGASDFRRGTTTGETTPWFPSARVFRQEKACEWGPVIERVREALHGERKPAGDGRGANCKIAEGGQVA